MMDRLSEEISPHLSIVLDELNLSQLPWQKMLGVIYKGITNFV